MLLRKDNGFENKIEISLNNEQKYTEDADFDNEKRFNKKVAMESDEDVKGSIPPYISAEQIQSSLQERLEYLKQQCSR